MNKISQEFQEKLESLMIKTLNTAMKESNSELAVEIIGNAIGIIVYYYQLANEKQVKENDELLMASIKWGLDQANEFLKIKNNNDKLDNA